VRHQLTVLLLFGFISFPAKGDTQEKWIPKAYSLFLATTDPDSEFAKGGGRGRFVQTLSIYCHEILERLPTNTPAEDAWVEAESRGTDTNKMNRLLASVEYSRQQLRITFSHCAEFTDQLKTADSEIAEATGLIRLARNFNADIVPEATRGGLNPTALAIDFLGAVRLTLLNAALRTLEGQ
jgi:hypothetical protein